MAVDCVDRDWRWRAVRDDVFGEPRLVAVGVLGLVLLIGGVVAESAALGTVGIVGAALVTAALVLPVVTRLTIGTVTFERSQTRREDAIAALADELGPTLHEVARWLSAAADEARVATWVRQSLALSYRDCGLVPRSEQHHHALCVLVRAVRAGTGMAPVTSPVGPVPTRQPGGVPVDLATIPFDDRAALVLRRVALLDDTAGARVLHTTPRAFAAAAERAAALLSYHGSGAG